MAEIHCRRCGSAAFVKSGLVRGHQRYRCRDCGCNFTDTPARGKPAAMKAQSGRRGGAALRHGQYELRHDRAAVRRQRGRCFQMDSQGSRGLAGADDAGRCRDRAARRDVAFRRWKKNNCWVWKAFDPFDGRAVAWVLGDRDDATCKQLLAKVGVEGRIFLTDDWEGYHRCIPDGQPYTGKDITFGIEQDNSNTRHYLARFCRRSKVTSPSRQMVDLSLRLLHHLRARPKSP
jgi:insertion element IS1 protein InsB